MFDINKITIIGDIHGRTIWKEIIKREADSNYFIFLGDYFDPYDKIVPKDLIINFNEIIKFKEDNPNKVILLCGNHDLHYVITQKCSRYNPETQKLLGDSISNLIKDRVLQACLHINFKDLWFVHAGVSNTWLRDNRLWFDEKEINNFLIQKPEKFGFSTRSFSDETGDNVYQSPFWIRPCSLNDDLPYTGYQFVGHTQVKNDDFRGLKYINFCDSLNWGRYYVYEMNPVTLGFEYKLKQI